MSDFPEPTYLYHVFGEAGLLLYIGISKDFGGRWKQHARTQPWWPERRTMTVALCDSRPEAEAAERAAIRAEHPKYNKVHNGAALVAQLRPAVVRIARQPTPWPGIPACLGLSEADELRLPVTLGLAEAARVLRIRQGEAIDRARAGELPGVLPPMRGLYRVSTFPMLCTPGIEVDTNELRSLMIYRDAA